MKKLKIDPTRQLRSASPKIPVSAVTRDLEPIIEPTGNLYESIVVIGRRARQIGAKEKAELTEKLAEFATGIDNLEEVFENREQIEISRHFERQPKPTATSIEEFLEDKLFFRKVEENESEEEF
jgi:DNA-directed RNA polymerase subunit K/omega